MDALHKNRTRLNQKNKIYSNFRNMYAKKTNVRRKYIKRAKTTKKAPTKKSISLPIKRYVKATIARQAEEKIVQYENTQTPVVEISSSTASYYVENLSTPFQISQGTSQAERIGNEIVLKSFVLRGYFLPVLAGSAPSFDGCLLKLYIGYRKDYSVITPSLTNLYQSGASSAAPQGTIYDMITPVNNDTYKIIYQRTFKLSPSNAATTPIVALPNNDFSLVRTFAVDLCKHGLKNRKIKYNDVATPPFDALINNLYMWCVATRNDGQAITTNNGPSLYNINFTSTIKFTDI